MAYFDDVKNVANKTVKTPVGKFKLVVIAAAAVAAVVVLGVLAGVFGS